MTGAGPEVLAGALPLLALLLVPAAVGVWIWLVVRRGRRLREWAHAAGWTWVGTDRTLTRRWHGTPFVAGHRARAVEVMHGTYRGRPAVSFVHQYTVNHGKNQQTVSHHVVAVSLPAYLPKLELTPENLGTRLAKALGGQDIVLESEEFNRAWRVQAHDPRFAHDILSPRLMEYLLRPASRGHAWRIEGTDVLSWISGSTNLDSLARRLDVLSTVADSVPRFVWQDHGYDPPAS
ncbi:DUF3137 domain-containing protein [Cellulomonas bogoriensis]|uniref:DUF3137 domain-containing protein n=1 Tax=Cellulomonas bogoriensis 69B4 = DSM 16987 TaxID=1386082 RepID=A0A0A0BPP9_9CELL|nr:DUF3137 domain-containing protein [Cellulomonas bogoriensis]KGM10458.1 hypothetical protein N869_04795 [Cellulomonas bogoriensis 69B4 = DSM 16987]